ncbi:MAG: hypothetical protein ACI3X1_03810 [Eubacteriales bacterium]
MFNFTKAIRGVLRRKNAQIRAEREKFLAAHEANKILSAYIAVLASEQDAVKVSKADVRTALNRYCTDISSDKDCYIIKVNKSEKGSLGKRESRAVK